VSRVVSLTLLVLIAAHVAHLPVIAFEVHSGPAELGEPAHLGHPAQIVQVPAQGAPPSEHVAASPHLAGHAGTDAECMTAAATLPMRAATPDVLTLPHNLPSAVEAGPFASSAAIVYPAKSSRRHLLLQVFLL
jgi:hypothetical protein